MKKAFFCFGKKGICQDESKCAKCRHSDNYGGMYITVEKDDINPYWERICEMADKQRAKGLETYGQGIEDNPAEMIKRIEHLQEELIDGLMYCEWIKDKLMEMEGKHDDQVRAY